MAEQMEAPAPTEQSAQEHAAGKNAPATVDNNAPSGHPSEGAVPAAQANVQDSGQAEPQGQPDTSSATPSADGAPAGGQSETADASGSAADAAQGTGGQPEGQEASPDGGSEAGPDGGKAKRKRRRKRKRKGAEGEATEGGGEERRKENPNAPFAHLFSSAAAAKRHAFAAGEVVAGRVVGFEHGVIHVDLFGKASAVADEFEPREVPPAPEPPPEAQASAAEQAAEPAGAAGTEGEQAPVEGTSAAASQAEQATDAPSDGVAAAAAGQAVPAQEAPVAAEPAGNAAEAAGDSAAQPAPTEQAGVQAGVNDGVAATVESAASQEVAASATEAQGEAEASGASEGVAPIQAPAAEEAPRVAESEDDEDATARGEGDAKGPLPPAPVVPESFGRPAEPAIGSIFKGRVGSVSESGHIILVNRNINRPETRAAIGHYREERRRVEGLVYGFNRGGFDVLVQGIRAFCPASAMSLQEIREPTEFLGKKFEFLLPVSKGGKDIVVSRRSILERQARKKAKELLRSLAPGQTLEGKVTSVRDFGLFVDIGGIEGLVHQSELSHGFGVKPTDVAQVGDTVQVQVLRVGGDPARKGEKKDRVTRVSLSMKALQADPWDSEAEAIAEGTVREGKITRTTDFGAFVELAPNIEGLLHISEFGRDLQHANQAVAEGDSVFVVVERADRKTRRISLSKLSEAELEDYKAGKLTTGAAPKNLRPGSRIEVQVEKADHRGVQVRVAGAIGRRSRGFIPASETGTERGSDLRKVFPAGETVEVKIIGNDRDGGLKCSVKALTIDDERRAVKDYRREASKQGFGTFGDLLRAKLGQSPE